MSGMQRLALAVLGVSALMSCVPRSAPGTCEDTEACRAIFGLGWECREDGYCDQTEPPEPCAEAWPPDLLTHPERYEEAILVGSLFNHQDERDEVRAAELAIRQVAPLLLDDDPPFGIIHCDLSDRAPRETLGPADAARWLVDAYGVKALIGPGDEAAVRAVHGAVAADAVVMLSPNATASGLDALDGETRNDANPGMFWRIAPTEGDEFRVLSLLLPFFGVNELVLLYDARWEPRLPFVEELLGDAVQVIRRPLDLGQIEATMSEAVALAELGSLMLLVDAPSVASAALSAASELHRYAVPMDFPRPPPPIIIPESVIDAELFDSLAPAMHPVVQGLAVKPPRRADYQVFAEAYGAAFDGAEPDRTSFAPFAYDAAWLLLYGATWSKLQEGRVHGLGIGRGLRQVSGPDSQRRLRVSPDSWSRVQARFAQALPVDVDGLSGPLNFDPSTGAAAVPQVLWYLEEGEPWIQAECTPAGCEELDGGPLR